MTRFGFWRCGFELEPGETEIGREPVSADLGQGFVMLEAAWLVVTDRRLILATLKIPLWLLMTPFVVLALNAWSSLWLIAVAVAAVLVWRRLVVRPGATQRREDLVESRIEAAPSVVLKPRLMLNFRNGARWRLCNPSKGIGRLDRIIAVMQKGGLAASLQRD